jgi:hypothetical protein
MLLSLAFAASLMALTASLLDFLSSLDGALTLFPLAVVAVAAVLAWTRLPASMRALMIESK